MPENKNTFEDPSCVVLTLTASDEVTSSPANWQTNMFKIPELN